MFQRRNRKATFQPDFIKDYTPIIQRELEMNETAYSCVDRIATAFAGLSFGVYDNKKKEKLINHNVYEVLKKPNLEEDHFLFFYQLIQDYYSGNVYLLKKLDDYGNVISLFRLNPSMVIVSRSADGYKRYTYNGIQADGTKFTKDYQSYEILHIPSRFGYNGLVGKSIFSECRKAFELAGDISSYAQGTFTNTLGKRLVADLGQAFPDATEEQKKQWLDLFMSNYSGVRNVGKPLIKDYGVEYTVLDTGASSSQGAELKDNRAFQRQIIADVFGVPIQYINSDGDFDIEQITTLFITNALMPLCKTFEEAFQNLFIGDDKYTMYVEFDFNSAMRTSLQSKIDAYTKQMNNGMLTVNEIRRKENLQPVEAGDYAFVPANLLPLTQDNIDAYMSSAKAKLLGANDQEKAAMAGTNQGVGSDKR